MKKNNTSEYHVLTEIDSQEINKMVINLLSESVSKYYARCIVQDLPNKETGGSFVEDVIKEIKCSVSWDKYNAYDQDDIKMCIGRTILSRLGIE